MEAGARCELTGGRAGGRAGRVGRALVMSCHVSCVWSCVVVSGCFQRLARQTRGSLLSSVRPDEMAWAWTWAGHGRASLACRTRGLSPKDCDTRAWGEGLAGLLKPNNKALARAQAQALPKPSSGFIWGRHWHPRNEERRGDCRVVCLGQLSYNRGLMSFASELRCCRARCSKARWVDGGTVGQRLADTKKRASRAGQHSLIFVEGTQKRGRRRKRGPCTTLHSALALHDRTCIGGGNGSWVPQSGRVQG